MWIRYGAAVLAAAAGFLATLGLPGLFSGIPFLPSFLAIFVAGWLGGGGPSLVAAGLGALGIALASPRPPDALSFILFVAVAIVAGLTYRELWSRRLRQAELLAETGAARASAEAANLDVQRTHEDRERLAAIVESSADAVIAKTLDGIVTAWNGGAERLFGYAAEEIIGKPISILMPPENRGDMDEILSKIVRGERVEHFETVRMKKSGERIEVSLSVSPVKDASGRVVGAAKIARDITEQRKNQAERERLLREAEAAARAREDFLSVAGHELRTPLSSLQFQLYTLKRRIESGNSARALEILDRAMAQLERLTRLTEIVLDVTRITTGRLELDLEQMDLATVIRDVVERHQDAAQRAGSPLEVEVGAGVTGLWDRSRLDQVLTNLLSNAIKFGRGKTIRIGAEADADAVRLAVRDQGIGISREDQYKIFERFERAVSRRSYGGMGLGLWIASQIVTAHGGRIGVASEPGTGSTFEVEMPRRARKGAAA